MPVLFSTFKNILILLIVFLSRSAIEFNSIREKNLPDLFLYSIILFAVDMSTPGISVSSVTDALFISIGLLIISSILSTNPELSVSSPDSSSNC